MNDIINERAIIGSNNPPVTLADTLAEKYHENLTDATNVLDAARSAPERIEDGDDVTAGRVADIIKKARAVEKSLDRAFEEEKAPHQLVVTQISGFFKTNMERLEQVRKRLTVTAKDYTDRKTAAEKKRLEEEAQRKREEAERKLREARDAEQTKNQAVSAQAEADRLAREADEARNSAVSEQEQAQAGVARAEAALAKVRADIAKINADFAKRVTEGNPATADEKADARAKAEAELKAARDDVDDARQVLSEARERAREAREAQRRADEEAARAASAAKTAAREEKAALTEAVKEEKAADRIEAKANGPEADLGRTRSVHGAVTTSQRRWTCDVTDFSKLDMAALWPFVSQDAKSAAAYKWMMTQNPENRSMPGTVMVEETIGVIR